MLILVYGGSGSGKSEYAEELVLQSSTGDGDRFYLATMANNGAESQKRINRHLKLREGKKFMTIECERNIDDAICDISGHSNTASVLLECLSNLVANEMFCNGKIVDEDDVVQKVLDGIISLGDSVKNLIVVSNNIHEDGVIYDEYTMKYIRALGRINASLAKVADRIVEVVVGIPIVVKY